MATRTKAKKWTTGDIRKWAMTRKELKDIVGERGRLSSAVIEAFNEAHPDEPYVNDRSVSVDVSGLIDQAEEFLRNSVTAGVALGKVNEVIGEMEEEGLLPPRVTERLKAAINEGLSTKS